MIHPAVSVLEYHLVNYRRTWRASVFSVFLLPLLILLAMGKSVGGYVDARSALGVPYLDYIAPGVLASTTFQTGVAEGAYPVYTAFHWSRSYHAMRATALRPFDILAGHLAYAGFRLTLSGLGFILVMTAFGIPRSPRALLALPAAILVGLSVTALVSAYGATVSSDNMFALLFRFGMVPMTLFAGVFFPVEAMPVAARALAYLSPLWHGVELCRASVLGTATAWGVPAHVGYLLVWSIGGTWLARVAFTRAMAEGRGER